MWGESTYTMRFAPRFQGVLVALLLVGTVATIGGAAAIWIDRQPLSTPRWTATSSRLIANSEIRRAIAGYAVRRAFTANGIDAALGHVLPGPLASRAETALRRSASGLAVSLLASGPGQQAWRAANRQTHAQLLIALDHARGNQEVILDLTPLLRDLVSALAGTTIARAIPGSSQVLAVHSPRAGQLVVARPDRVRRLRREAAVIRILAWVLPLSALAAFLLALALARGRRARTLSAVGYGLVVAGAVILAARVALRAPLADALVSTSTDRGAVRAAWTIATSGLRSSGVAIAIAGLVVVVVSWGMRLVRR